MRLLKKGQSAVEYTLLIIIIIAVFVATSLYIKRGIQGRWREAVDSIGEQYDPTAMGTDLTHTLVSSANTFIETVPGSGGYWTMRTDTSNSVETRSGEKTIWGY